ncbi:TM2 domain-containing protein [Candidatus Gracilibacteria bacterium]|nr:TM2 domain-containing protein [Candidatus Gracilibacteria bacterium]NJM90111.1 TM2 domain-containing protein [Hydrococcus sp. RU_2_2]NJP20236.1 TM2 domain-containing protein [Hydrococcus sp. CRU_1_1]NJQ97924.1 TM2 domain-containing protein [Hydrococcus sp. CSU_1_8]
MSGSINKGSDEKFCHECGAVIRAKAEICSKCGVRQPLSSSTVSGGGRNRVQAGLFALLLGGVGVHKFYLGRTGQGIVYLKCHERTPATPPVSGEMNRDQQINRP